MTFYFHHSFLRAILDRIREPLLDRIPTCLPPLVQRDKGHLDLLCLFTLDPDDPFHYRLTSIFRPHTLSHTLHDRMTAAYPDDILTLPRRRNRPDLVVDKQPRSDDRRIAQPPTHLEPHPTRCHTAAQVARRIHRHHPDRIVIPLPVRQPRRRSRPRPTLRIFNIDHRLILRLLQPLCIRLLCIARQHLRLQREPF